MSNIVIMVGHTCDTLDEAANRRAAVASVSLISILSSTCRDFSFAITLSLKSSGYKKSTPKIQLPNKNTLDLKEELGRH